MSECTKHDKPGGPTFYECDCDKTERKVQPAPAGFEEALWDFEEAVSKAFYGPEIRRRRERLLAFHAREVEEAEERAYRRGCTDASEGADYTAARAAGKREAFREALEFHQRASRPAFADWLTDRAERALEEKV